jgi:hypothetical protein
MNTKTNKTVSGAGDEFPIALSIGGTPIGAARSIAEEQESPGVFRFHGLDFIARVFFAERVGPGGPEDTRLRDVCVQDRGRQRTMRASEATVRSFSAGTGELEITGRFADQQADPLADPAAVRTDR